MKVSELECETLDYWVMKAEHPDSTIPYSEWVGKTILYSRAWQWGGPIIERERICIEHEAGEKLTRVDPYAYTPDAPNDGQFGRTVLLAAMRCYVASKFGAEVPDSANDAPQTAG